MIFGLTFVQTISGLLNEIAIGAWFWVFLNLLGVGILLYITSLNQRKSKIRLIPNNIHRTIILVTFSYLFLVLATLLFEQLATRSEMSMYQFRGLSLSWLVPAQIFTMIGYYFVFIRKSRDLIVPVDKSDDQKNTEESEILLLSEKKRTHLQDLISNGNIGKVFKELEKELANSPQIKAILLLKAQWNENKRKRNLGLISNESFELNLNRITLVIIEMIDRN